MQTLSDPQFTFVLIHSPLVGPLTWAPVAESLRRRGHPACIPALTSRLDGPRPYWQQHISQVIDSLRDVPARTPLVLVGHSGGGILLPLIRQQTQRPVSAYLFVDAGIPLDGQSRLDLFETPEAADEVRRSAVDGFLPVWSDGDLREVIPADDLRRDFVRELRPLPLDVYEEPIPVFAGWPDAPVRYLRFGDNPAYAADIAHAERAAWPVERIEGAHFHMLVDPEGVASKLVQLANIGSDLR